MPHNEVAYIGLNQEKTCIVTNLQGGYDIFKIDPLRKIASNNNGMYKIIEMYGSSSLIAVVGSGEDLSYSSRHLHLINLVDSSEICNLTFVSSIICVKMTLNRLIVALKDRLYIYSLSDMKLLHIINDMNNNKGILSVSYSEQNNILCYPISTVIKNSDSFSMSCENISIKDSSNHNINDYNNFRNQENLSSKDPISNSLPPDDVQRYGGIDSYSSEYSDSINTLDVPKFKNTKISGDVAIFDLNSLQPYLIVEAHKSSIRMITLSNDGTLLATASKLGTIIRIFKVSSGEGVAQFRRGRYPSKIKCISFSNDNKYLIVSSSSHNIHIFAIKLMSNPEITLNREDINSIRLPAAMGEEREDKLNGISNISELDGDDNDEFVLLTNQPESVRYPRSMKTLLKSSSRALSRGATKQFNKYFTNSSTSEIDPKRNIAFCTIPTDISTTSNLVAIGDLQDIRKSDYPEVFPFDKDQETMQDWVRIRKVYMINEDGYILVFLFDPHKGGECILFTKLLLPAVDGDSQ
ncbi:autophagy protein [Monosporozyma unispora]|nr:autophagy protein [Kazachstania unispora]